MMKKKLDQIVYDYIVEQIDNGQLMEREHITEQTIADQLEISRTPVRKAFDRLVAEDYLENIVNVGVRVKARKLTVGDFQDRLDFFERLANHYLFDLEKREVPFDSTALYDSIDKMKIALDENQEAFNSDEYGFWKQLLQYDSNLYTQKVLLKTLKECLDITGHIHEIMESSRSLKIDHYIKLAEYLNDGEYSRARREIRILLNQLKLNVIESESFN